MHTIFNIMFNGSNYYNLCQTLCLHTATTLGNIKPSSLFQWPPFSRWTWISQSPVLLLHLFQKRTFQNQIFLRARCAVCHRTNSVKRSEGNSKQWPQSATSIQTSKVIWSRPHCRLVTPRGCKWIRLFLASIQYLVSWTHKSQPPNGILIGSAVFARHIRVTVS